MADLAEKPGPQAACVIERRYGRSNLFLLEGRIRLTAAFTEFARKSRPPARAEPKLAAALAEYATSHPVHIVEASEDVTDLGSPASRITLLSGVYQRRSPPLW
jgi:UTP-glucose-1-phosphate uridylyltransferase